VEDVESWTDGLLIPARMPGSDSSITSDTNGNVLPVTVWSDPSTVGSYDIIVDVNKNGRYDEGIDALDNNDIEVTAGFVIPEFSSFTALLLFFSLAVVLSIFTRRKQKP
jgi:hypothetical protein